MATATTSTFHPFQRLPLELRILIWELTVESRVVELRVAAKGPMRHLRSSTPVPAQLQTCREAREHPTTHHDTEGDPERERYVWFNYEIDILSIGKTEMGDLWPISHHIRRLRLERPLSDEFFCRFESKLLTRLRSLVEVQFVSLNGVRSGYLMAEYLEQWLAPEDVYFADPDDVDGTMINSIDLDAMINEQGVWRMLAGHGRMFFDAKLLKTPDYDGPYMVDCWRYAMLSPVSLGSRPARPRVSILGV
ncbi:hypothetical protein CSOJ01_12905 [Colletotrichum sojae]|uniref:2EXR domain-containing protein n=1 Tax=Colletotrichum sojae TaxID=2175907 RepID=A0A8H6ITL6_9PEZI|nr:hypothetical protein CSOJ01_12905 [Colletotrichum sojae]